MIISGPDRDLNPTRRIFKVLRPKPITFLSKNFLNLVALFGKDFWDCGLIFLGPARLFIAAGYSCITFSHSGEMF